MPREWYEKHYLIEDAKPDGQGSRFPHHRVEHDDLEEIIELDEQSFSTHHHPGGITKKVAAAQRKAPSFDQAFFDVRCERGEHVEGYSTTHPDIDYLKKVKAPMRHYIFRALTATKILSEADLLYEGENFRYDTDIVRANLGAGMAATMNYAERVDQDAYFENQLFEDTGGLPIPGPFHSVEDQPVGTIGGQTMSADLAANAIRLYNELPDRLQDNEWVRTTARSKLPDDLSANRQEYMAGLLSRIGNS